MFSGGLERNQKEDRAHYNYGRESKVNREDFIAIVAFNAMFADLKRNRIANKGVNKQEYKVGQY